MRYLTVADIKEWRSLVDRLPEFSKDVHFLPEMVLPYEATGRGVGTLYVVQQGPEFLIWPMLVKADEPVRHVYNFGGPQSTWGFDPEYHIPDCECTFNPFFATEQNLLTWYNAKYEKDSVWVDLKNPDDFRPTTRHEIAKAKVSIDWVVPIQATIGTFTTLYERAMDRLQAAPHWRFSLRWFTTLFEAMPQHTALLLARDDSGETVAGCVLLYGYGTCYYHFSASAPNAPRGTNQKMVAEAIKWARERGLNRFHLGGGVKPSDGLYVFKSGFSSLRLPVYRYKRSAECRVAS